MTFRAMRRWLILLVGVATTSAAAQQPNPPLRVIPPPPNFATDAASGTPAHHATQSAIDPEHAFDPVTGESLSWDCARKSWINARNQPIGFAGQTGVNGEVIPPPPLISGNAPQTTSADPDHAVEPKTGTNLVWDRDTKTWRDIRTNKDLGYQGVVLRDTCPSTHAAVAQITPRAPATAPRIRFDEGISGEEFITGIHYDYRSFYKLKDIVSTGPLASSEDVTSATNGVGGFIGVKLPSLPAFGTVNGYWSTGLMTNITLSNGHRSQSDIDDYGAGIGITLMPSGRRRFSPYLFGNAMFEWNKSKYQEFNTAGALSFTEDRTHTTWTGEYGVGGNFWITPNFGIGAEASYNGIFKSTNANENFKLGAGLTLRLGQ